MPSPARAVFDTTLHGDVTGRYYGYARPAEADAMLAAAPLFSRASCPPADPPDEYLIPGPASYYFWEAWTARLAAAAPEAFRGGDTSWALPPHPSSYEPPVTFYCGSHMTSWLWDGKATMPLCISYGRLRRHKRFTRRARVPWILDSRAFSELSQHGRWTISPEEYLAFVVRCDEEIGGLQWCGPQDWMCENEVIHGGMLGRVPCVGTGLSVQAHQELTVQSYLDLTRLWPQFSTRPCPVIPVLQADTPAGYLRCYQMYLDAGVDLGEECQLVGVGSVCRQQRTGQIAATARLLGELGVDLHYFGVKLTGLTRPELQRDLRKPFSGGVASLDSESWSLEARYGTRRPDCTHLGRDGQPNKCNNCPAYAAWWAGGVTNAVTAGFWAASRRPQQTALFSEYDLLADAP